MSDRNTIFLLEDNSLLLEQLRLALERDERIKNKQLKVVACQSIKTADTIYSMISKNIVCLVCDSNMASIGLPEKLRNESNGGLFSGWLWLREKINADETLACRSIMYSAYYDELQTVMRQAALYKNVECIRKGTITSWDTEDIIQKIVDIVEMQLRQ
jgi:hypothetical protein